MRRAARSHAWDETVVVDFGRVARPRGGVSDGEARALAALASGATLEVAARDLGVSARTVRRRVRDVGDRAGVATTVEAVVWAAKRGVI